MIVKCRVRSPLSKSLFTGEAEPAPRINLRPGLKELEGNLSVIVMLFPHFQASAKSSQDRWNLSCLKAFQEGKSRGHCFNINSVSLNI
jgi:hypothetical protein